MAYKQQVAVAIDSAAIHGALNDLVAYHATDDGEQDLSFVWVGTAGAVFFSAGSLSCTAPSPCLQVN